MKADAKLERQIAALGVLSRDELAALWEKQYGCPPPKGIKRGLLERSAAWHLQARRLGGLSPTIRRILKAIEKDYLVRQSVKWSMAKDSGLDDVGSEEVAEDQPAQDASADAAPTILQPKAVAPSRPMPTILSPGTRLLREWNGRMYAVDVLEKGFVMDGRTYRSLSAIAKRITGAEWSGPRFFRL